MIRAFFSNYSFAADTQINIGDTLTLPNTKRLLVLVKEPEYCHNQVMSYLASGYTINVDGGLYTYNQNPGYDSDYKRLKPWTLSNGNVAGVMVDRLFRSFIDELAAGSLLTEVDKLHLYISGYYSVVSGMRFVTSTGKKFRIEQIEDYRFPGINVCFVTNDTRA